MEVGNQGQSGLPAPKYRDLTDKDDYPGLFSLVCEIDSEVNVIYQIKGKVRCVRGILICFDQSGSVYLAKAQRKSFVEVDNDLKELTVGEKRTYIIRRNNIILIQKVSEHKDAEAS